MSETAVLMLKTPHVRKSGFQTPGNFSRGIQNPGKILPVESGILGFGIRYKAQGIRNPGPLETGIQNPNSTDKDWNPVPGIPNPRHTMQNPRLSWIPLHGAIESFLTVLNLLYHLLKS